MGPTKSLVYLVAGFPLRVAMICDISFFGTRLEWSFWGFWGVCCKKLNSQSSVFFFLGGGMKLFAGFGIFRIGKKLPFFERFSGWWFQTFSIFTPTWGRFPF